MSAKETTILNTFTDALKSTEKKTSAYDTTAVVRRIEDGTAWVHIDGGVDETPVKLTIAAQIGDRVQVRVSDGRAFLVGNASAPPTDDRIANVARTIAQTAEKKADQAEETAEQSGILAGQASTTANAAKKIADDTSQYFWFLEDSYELSKDTAVISGKTYYVKNGASYEEVTPVGTEDPTQEGWYEFIDSTGAHITEIPKEDFLADKQGGNLLARSNGIAVRDGVEELATFGAGYAIIGNDDIGKTEISTDGISFYDKYLNKIGMISSTSVTNYTIITRSLEGDVSFDPSAISSDNYIELLYSPKRSEVISAYRPARFNNSFIFVDQELYIKKNSTGEIIRSRVRKPDDGRSGNIVISNTTEWNAYGDKGIRNYNIPLTVDIGVDEYVTLGTLYAHDNLILTEGWLRSSFGVSLDFTSTDYSLVNSEVYPSRIRYFYGGNFKTYSVSGYAPEYLFGIKQVDLESGAYAFQSGQFVYSGYDNQSSFGKYNDNKADNAFEIGNGDDIKNSNAFTVDWLGETELYLDVVLDDNDASPTYGRAVSGTDMDLYNSLLDLGWKSEVIS